ncbi:MAG TPA: hypothetical protein VD738_03155 [Nitrospira sp.]|nr:hypothetical protein [Nitrospira sp.]
MKSFVRMAVRWRPILPNAPANGNRSRRIIDSLWRLCYPPTNAIDFPCSFLRNHLLGSFMSTGFISSAHAQSAAWRIRRVQALLLCLCLTVLLPANGMGKTKPPRPPRPEPELKIVELNIAPTPYQPGNGALEFSVTVQLPKELNGSTVLEVSSLISSPSKTSLRFLSARQPVQAPVPNGVGNPPTVSVQLSWDGKDQRRLLVGSGTYSYEVRTKLLVNDDKGPRTMMVAWPKRGTLEVK